MQDKPQGDKMHKLIALTLTSVLLGACALFGGRDVFAQTSSDSFDSLRQMVDNGDIPGVVVCIATPGKPTVTEVYGWADLERKAPMTKDSFFWIASNTKAIVAAAVMICVEEGLLDLDVPVDTYLPQLKELTIEKKQDDGTVLLCPVVNKPTLRQALSHTAGFRFITPYQEKYGIDSLPVQRHMTIVGLTPLIAEPGARYSYSNLGIDVAQACVEVVAKKPFETFLQERVFDPLEMRDATFYPSEEQMKRLALPYGWNSNAQKLEKSTFSQTPSLDDGSPRYAEGGGGLFATADDMLKFYQMLSGNGVGSNGKRILKPESVAEISKKQTGDLDSKYGFGVVVNNEWFGHGGAFGTQGVAYRDGSVAAVYMIAVTGVPKQGAAENVFREAVANYAREGKSN